jgi:hypothetical protein
VKKKIIVIALIIVVVVALAIAVVNIVREPAGELIYVVSFGYVCNEYVETGVYDGHPLVFIQNQNMFAYAGQQYFTLLDDRLRNVPEGMDRAATMIDDRVHFNSVTVRRGTAYVDIASAGLFGSSLEEGLLVSQIVSSLVVSFEEIERVQFLVDGNVTDTLMGHIDVSAPFERGIYVTGLE